MFHCRFQTTKGCLLVKGCVIDKDILERILDARRVRDVGFWFCARSVERRVVACVWCVDNNTRYVLAREIMYLLYTIDVHHRVLHVYRQHIIIGT